MGYREIEIPIVVEVGTANPASQSAGFEIVPCEGGNIVESSPAVVADQ
jgi:hypothetical protein